MSFFAVTIETIAELRKIPEADSIELCLLEGVDFQFVVRKGEWKKGQKCLYIPLDAIVSESLLEHLGLVGKLAGSNKNRVKTIKLRGQISQGLICNLSVLNEMPLKGLGASPEDITKFLGVVKYEPPDPTESGQLYKSKEFNRTRRTNRLPEGQSVYDIEGCERNANAVLELAVDGNVSISEKIEGMNFSLTLQGYSYKNCLAITHFSVNTRQQQIDYDPEHPFWKATANQFLERIARLLLMCFTDKQKHNIVIYGEFIGPKVQGNIYKLQEHQVRLFDIKIDNGYMDPPDFIQLCEQFNILYVPILAYDVDLVEWINDQMPEGWLKDHLE